MARNGILLAAAALFAWTAFTAAGAAAPKVVASIGPVHSLVASVMAGLGEPALVVSGKGSPHAYALKPSDVRTLHGADLVFWVGPDLETFLANTFERMAGRVRSVALSEAAGVNLLPNRAGGLWAERPGDGGEGSHDADGHGRGRTDMHVWLDPLNAQAMVEAIVAALAETDAGGAVLYRANGARTRERLAALDREIAAQDGFFIDNFEGVDTYQYEGWAPEGDMMGYVKDPNRELPRLMPGGYGYKYGPTAVRIYEVAR